MYSNIKILVIDEEEDITLHLKDYKKYKDITDIILEGLWMVDKKGYTIYVNRQLSKMLGYYQEEIINRPFLEFIDTSFRDKAKEFFERRKQGLKDTYDSRLIKKNGSTLWATISAIPIYEKGNFAGEMGLLTDITEHKLAEESLQRSRQEWHSTFDAISDIICIVDTDGKILICNKASKDLFNKPLDQIIGRTCWEIFNCPPDLKDKCPIMNQIKIPERKTLTTKIKNKWYYSLVDPIIDNYNNVIGAVHVISDITKYKLNQIYLQESEERYRTIIEHSNDMIWTLDTEGLFTFFNKRSENISGYKLEELKGKSFLPLIIPQDLPKVTDIFYSVLQGQSIEYEITFINKFNKNITLAVNTAPIYSKGKVVGTTSFGRDITQQKKVEAKIKKTADELERSNKELEQFAYIVSHDLQEPLRSISTFTEFLARRYKDRLDSEADEFIDYIMSSTKRMQEMINDLLALSRVGTKGKEFLPINVKNVLESVITNLHTLIDDNIANIIVDDLPIVDADEIQLIQLFQNLIDNAIKFRKKDVFPIIHISAKQEGNEWIFSIQDNGIGIDPKNFKKLFVIFQRLHKREEYPGTGIGLAMCKKIVERHGGRIWIESKLGEGSIFFFSIPIKRGENNNGI